MSTTNTNENTNTNEIEEMMKAVASYTGPVTRCRPGRARAPAKKALAMNGAVEWLKQHRADQPTKDPEADRKRLRRARAQRERVARRNAAVRKRVGRARVIDEIGATQELTRKTAK
jgi:hypothetical protein